ncbi:MAG: TolC family protein [Mangrovibacterium sp.]
MNRSINEYYILPFCCVLLFSCRSMKDSSQYRQEITQGIYRDAEGQDTTNIASLHWKEIFTDPLLQAYIDEAIRNNFDLQIAAARIKQAQANFRQSRAALLPSLDANGAITWSKEGRSGFDKLYELSLSSGWEIDIWGKLRSSKRASLTALLQSEAYKRSVQTRLVADVASYYFTLLAYHAEMNILKQTIETYREDVRTMKKLKESNSATGADVVQSEANYYSAAVTVSTLKQSIRETENSLCLLLGRTPESLPCSTFEEQEISVDLHIGIPAQLLANRPDVQEAEFAFRYYSELTHVAQTYFYPALTLTAEAGYNHHALSDFFDPSSFFSNIIGGITAPLFSNRQNKQRLEVAKAQEEEYFTAFKQTVMDAGVEVSNALYAYQIASEKTGNRSKQVLFLEKSVEYTKKLLQYTSNTNYTDVLTSEQNLLSARLDQVGDQLDRLTAIIDLYRSLGGGTE